MSDALPSSSGSGSRGPAWLASWFVSPKNMAGMALATVGVVLFITGVIGPGWPLIVVGLYALGALVAPLSAAQRRNRDQRRALRQAKAALAATVARVNQPHERAPDEVRQLVAAIERSALDVLASLPDHAIAVRTEVTQLAGHYLPVSVANYLAVAEGQRSRPGPDGVSPDVLVVGQLRLLEGELTELAREANAGQVEELERHGQFLNARFSDPLEW